MQITQLLNYSEQVRPILRETLLANEDVFDTPFETTSHFTSIHKILAHIIGAEERWITVRLLGNPFRRYEERAAPTVAAMFADWDAIRANTFAYVREQSEADLAATLHLRVGPQNDMPLSITREGVLFHIVNHETYHRGQIVMLLQRAGVVPVDFDYSSHQPEADYVGQTSIAQGAGH